MVPGTSHPRVNAAYKDNGWRNEYEEGAAAFGQRRHKKHMRDIAERGMDE